MSELLRPIDLTYPQFRAEQGPVPMVSAMEQLEETAELRVKPGLDVLYDNSKSSPEIDYAGYALTTYLHPQQRLEFQYPEAAEELKVALAGMGLAVDSGPRLSSQDFYVEFGDCFDIRALTQKYWPHREGVYKQEDFKQNGYILGPIVRLHVDLI
jgi:hypothetical protein